MLLKYLADYQRNMGRQHKTITRQNVATNRQ